MWVIIKIPLFVSFLSDKIIEKFHSAPEKGLKIRSDEANYLGFELNRQKTEKPTSLNICCSRASQLVTKNPPDSIVMLVLTSLLGVIFYHWVSKLTNLKNIIGYQPSNFQCFRLSLSNLTEWGVKHPSPVLQQDKRSQCYKTSQWLGWANFL